MTKALDKLVSIASDPLLHVWRNADAGIVESLGDIGRELLDLLRQKNGFFAFESALHLFPLGPCPECSNLASWNDPKTWRSAYGDLIPASILFFAQDVYGNQFSIDETGVGLFYSEFAQVEFVAKTLEEWAQLVLADWQGFTGYDVSHEWQIRNGPLRQGERLIPKIPFVVGGKYEITNLYCGQIVDAMRFRGSLASQLRDLPNGSPVSLHIRGDGDEGGELKQGS